ncbi:MAG: cytochrome C [Ignavibacteria bacterium]|nr:cytochrome C [Ignavibacteria bacterium]
MKITKLYIFLIAGLLIFLSTTAYLVKDSAILNKNTVTKVFSIDKNVAARYDNSKTIKFNHKIHIIEAGVSCADCHISAANSIKSADNLNPKEEVCATCHDVKDEKTCNLCHYDGVYKKLKVNKTELIFSHKQHIVTEKKVCTDCHVGLEKVKYSKESETGFPNMESCFSCHNTQKASNSCENCHSNLTNLTPQNHRSPNFLNEHKLSDISSGKNNCMMCHSDNLCQACHSPVTFIGKNSKEGFYAPYYTKETGVRTDRTALQKLTTAHTLNYKFTHGLDANQKSFECKTCHEQSSFCAECHQTGGELITGLTPTSHQVANFTTFGVNTGGGLHSDLAKKDIESCASCHDIQGRDPACVKCHFDNDGVKGTNPKTHESGFMKDDRGIFHNTEGANCYSCHTDANARPNGNPGVAFCGYCHGAK